MGDEPYAALLPWVVFAVIDRAHGDPLWAGVGALDHRDHAARHEHAAEPDVAQRVDARRGRLVRRHRRRRHREPDRTPASSRTTDARSRAAGFAVIAFGSLAFTPARRVLHAPARAVRAVGRPRVPPRQRPDHADLGGDVHRDRARALRRRVDEHARGVHRLQLGRPDRAGGDRRAPARGSAGTTSTTTTSTSPTRSHDLALDWEDRRSTRPIRTEPDAHPERATGATQRERRSPRHAGTVFRCRSSSARCSTCR